MNNRFMPRSAFAEVKGDKNAPKLNSRVSFQQKANGVLVTANIKGLPRDRDGFFRFRVSEFEECKGDDFPEPKIRPRPDWELPSLLSNKGFAYMQVFTDRFNIGDIIGKTVAITADSGETIGCGEIRPTRR